MDVEFLWVSGVSTASLCRSMLFAPSLAEVLVFAGLVQSMAAHGVAALLPPALAAGAAVLASSIAFALYHLTHAAPWNGWPLIRTLFLVWLVVGATYAWTGNLWAATIANTIMATIGFIRNDVTRAEEQRLWLSLGLDVAAVVAVAALLGRAAGHTG